MVGAQSAAVHSSSLRFTSELAELVAIYDRDVNVVTLSRVPSHGLVEDARRAVAEPAFRRVFSVNRTGASRSISHELTGFPELAQDVLFWVEALAELTGAVRVGVRVARLETAMCPLFHVDRLTLRLVSTYVGRGTEIIADEHVDRTRLGHAARDVSDELSGLVPSPECIRVAEPFDVVLLKGEAWPESTGFGAVHRSPAANRESCRLVMTLDPMDS